MTAASEPDCATRWEALPRAHGEPPAQGRLRVEPEDFQVDELLGFEAAGKGQHVLLQVRKRGVNTQWLAGAIARHAGVTAAAVGYCGLKDRHALTTQWLSVDLAGRPEPDWSALAIEGVEVLAARAHDRKLRRGAHRANRFRVRLRDVLGERAGIEARLRRVREAGAPSYFGEQRFGARGENPARALEMLAGKRRVRDRGERGIYLSAARAVVFNRVLAARVSAGTWALALAGEVLMLDGRHSRFLAEASTAELAERVARGELHPTGPLWGRGEPESRGECRALEASALAGCGAWLAALEAAGLEQDRRALRVLLPDLAWEWLPEGDLRLAFTLTSGAYATAVLREILAGPAA